MQIEVGRERLTFSVIVKSSSKGLPLLVGSAIQTIAAGSSNGIEALLHMLH